MTQDVSVVAPIRVVMMVQMALMMICQLMFLSLLIIVEVFFKGLIFQLRVGAVHQLHQTDGTHRKSFLQVR